MSVARIIDFTELRPIASNDNAVASVVDGQTIYNVYNLAGQLIHVNQVNDNTTTDYVSLNGRSVARLRKVGSDVHRPIYIYSDHLGSPVGQSIGSVSTNIIRERYTPFGIAMDTPSQLDDQGGFTGHIKDKATDLNYMQARYYDPVIGRFLSVDPVTFLDTGNPGYFNRYAYTMNDPINNLDPDGKACVPCAGIVAFLLKEGASEAVEQTTGVPMPTVKNAGKLVVKEGTKQLAKSKAKDTVKDTAKKPVVKNTGKRASDSGPNSRHGDGGRKLNAAEKQIKKLEQQASEATGTDKKKINAKIQNIKKNAQKAKKGVEHSRTKKK